MLDYVAEIRVTIELVLTMTTLWWTIRTFAVSAVKKDQLKRREDELLSHIDNLHSSIRKIEEATKKIRLRVVPSQAAVISQLRGQLVGMEKDLEKSQLPLKVQFYREVKKFYMEQPGTRYFRASDWRPPDDMI